MPAVPPVLPGHADTYACSAHGMCSRLPGQGCWAPMLTYFMASLPLVWPSGAVSYACLPRGCAPARQAGNRVTYAHLFHGFAPARLTRWPVAYTCLPRGCAPARQAGNGVTYAHLFHGFAPARLARDGGTSALLASRLCSHPPGRGADADARPSHDCGPSVTPGMTSPPPRSSLACGPVRKGSSWEWEAHLHPAMKPPTSLKIAPSTKAPGNPRQAPGASRLQFMDAAVHAGRQRGKSIGRALTALAAPVGRCPGHVPHHTRTARLDSAGSTREPMSRPCPPSYTHRAPWQRWQHPGPMSSPSAPPYSTMAGACTTMPSAGVFTAVVTASALRRKLFSS